ncbi:hypothetical protein PSACC_03613 [Paramicrosporidium saccamoebae]|uniref:Uncharacterized protein n=1 Tax=Paramicrosporidium saccamoebae TaxID=1246581 RepID=A0A2H9TFL2_9FUNG|nr:hypothetical protein PSACC_03613 [Paramicrosporidium saccamoebae]
MSPDELDLQRHIDEALADISFSADKHEEKEMTLLGDLLDTPILDKDDDFQKMTRQLNTRKDNDLRKMGKRLDSREDEDLRKIAKRLDSREDEDLQKMVKRLNSREDEDLQKMVKQLDDRFNSIIVSSW